MYKIYSKDGNLIMLSYNDHPSDGWLLEGETADSNYLLNARLFRIEEIKKQLESIDFKSIRPLREGNLSLVQSYELEAEALRVELRKLLEVQNGNTIS